MTRKEKWYKSMRERLGVESDEEVRRFMSESGAKASRTGVGGFAYDKAQGNTARIKAMSKKALDARWGKDVKQKTLEKQKAAAGQDGPQAPATD